VQPAERDQVAAEVADAIRNQTSLLKKKYLVFGVMAASSIYCMGQKSDSVYSKRKVSRTEIQFIYSHYIQNGNHSAVTGGEGTEKLIVYSPNITFGRAADSTAGYSVNMGVDIITSASTDNIDFVVSSASRTDIHGYVNCSYSKRKKGTGLIWSISGAASIESDYLSAAPGFSLHHTSKDKSRQLSARLEVFFDDLRWGRFSSEKDLKLVYPQELRYREWFTEHSRQSFNLNLSWQRTINKRMLLAVFPGIIYQQGLLSTPFHRVYFTDGSEKVENLPRRRWKFPLGIQLNSFLGNKTFLRSYYRFYIDDFGVLANTIELDLPVKISPAFTLSPSFRIYTQRGSKFFKPYRQNLLQDRFYTSDHDLSSFQSYEPGLEMRFTGLQKKPASSFNNLGLRYSFYKRTDGLSAHTLTLLVDYFSKKK